MDGAAIATGDASTVAQLLHDGVHVDDNDALVLAVEKGHLPIIDLLLDADAALERRDDFGWTPLANAVGTADEATALRLLAAGASADHETHEGMSALMVATMCRRLDALLANNVDVNGVDSQSDSALTIACSMNIVKGVQTLVAAGADTGHTTEQGETGLMIAASKGYDSIVSALLSGGADVNTLNPQCCTSALTLEIVEGHMSIVVMLPKSGADIESEDDTTIEPDGDVVMPLTCAASFIRIDILRLLLDAGADANACDGGNNTALAIAASRGFSDLVSLLLSIDGVHIDHANADGDSALLLACDLRSTSEVAEMLLAAGASPRHVNTKGETTLMRACRSGFVDLSRCLAAQGVSVDATDSRGWTALLYATEYARLDAVEALLTTQRVDVNHAANDGTTALLLAARNGDDKIMPLLLAHGAATDQIDRSGRTLLRAAADGDNPDAVVTLLLVAGADVWTSYAARETDLDKINSLLALAQDRQ